MSDNKLLTLCIPTYNRGVHLKEQLIRLSQMPFELWDDITVLVSDNCSTDDTEAIGEEFAQSPNCDIHYSRNETNLGMDGNFVKCFKAATSKYVWLLGDDDYIFTDKLPLILKVLKETNCGLCHLGRRRNEKEDYTLYNDVELFIKEIAVNITFISSNIVRTDFVGEIDFEKYFGTFLTLVPLYLTAMIKGGNDVMINVPIFDNPKDKGRNGGYSIAQVFIENYLSIFKEYECNGLLSNDLYKYEKKMVFNFTIPHVVKYVLLNKPSQFKKDDKTWSILYKHYGYTKTIIATMFGVCKYYGKEILKR